MAKTHQSKKTGSTKWILVRVSGAVLLVLLLAHFWVHHFFVKDFYGKMNIIDFRPDQRSLSTTLPFLGHDENTELAPLLPDLRGTQSFLSASNVTGPTPITIVKQNQRTDMLRGAITDRTKLEDLLNRSVPRSATVRTYTINPAQIQTKTMINFSDVHARVGGEGWIWWKVYNLLFLGLGLYHGLIGIWDVLLDYKMSPVARMSMYGVLVTLGLVLLIAGVLIIVPM